MTLWSLAQRTGTTRDHALDALATGTVVRTHAMRTTWHFVHRDDLVAVQVATADRVHKLLRPMLAQKGLGEADLRAWRAWLSDLLAAGPLTRAQVKSRLPGSPFGFDGMTLGFALMWAELELLVASGPPRGQVHTYQLVEAGWPRPDRDVAIGRLLERFLASHGPSTIGDVCAWSGLTVASVRGALSDLASQVESEQLAGARRYWIGPVVGAGWPREPTVELLNGFDEYVSGLDARSKTLLDPDGLNRQRPGTPFALVMIDGALAGHWRRAAAAGSVRVQVHPLRALSAAECDGLAAAVSRYSQFADRPATWEMVTPAG